MDGVAGDSVIHPQLPPRWPSRQEEGCPWTASAVTPFTHCREPLSPGCTCQGWPVSRDWVQAWLHRLNSGRCWKAWALLTAFFPPSLPRTVVGPEGSRRSQTL